jgi:hypothetical protein
MASALRVVLPVIVWPAVGAVSVTVGRHGLRRRRAELADLVLVVTGEIDRADVHLAPHRVGVGRIARVDDGRTGGRRVARAEGRQDLRHLLRALPDGRFVDDVRDREDPSARKRGRRELRVLDPHARPARVVRREARRRPLHHVGDVVVVLVRVVGRVEGVVVGRDERAHRGLDAHGTGGGGPRLLEREEVVPQRRDLHHGRLG